MIPIRRTSLPFNSRPAFPSVRSLPFRPMPTLPSAYKFRVTLKTFSSTSIPRVFLTKTGCEFHDLLFNNNPKINELQKLLEAGFDPNFKNDQGLSPLYLTLEQLTHPDKRKRVLELLFKHGAKVDPKEFPQKVLFHVLLKQGWSLPDKYDTLKILLDNGEDVNATSLGNTLLELSIIRKCLSQRYFFTRLFLTRGAVVTEENIDRALSENDQATAKILYDHAQTKIRLLYKIYEGDLSKKPVYFFKGDEI